MKIKYIFPLILGLFMAKPIQSQNKPVIATFAGGCFWCMEPPFEKLDGVIDVVSGYMGGTGKNPTYENYAKTGHVETIEITYDPQKISYEQLLDTYWRQIDPTDPDGSFVDRGPQYRSVIFYQNDAQKKEAEQSKKELAQSGRFDKPIVTEILPASTFYKAEEYHQNYAETNPWKYGFYRARSGRDQFLNSVWSKQIKPEKTTDKKDKPSKKETLEKEPISKIQKKYTKPSDSELKKKLTPLQYQVTQEDGTERAYDNKYWNNYEPGIYVDVVSGEPLFSSIDQYDSKTGWPSFSKPLESENIIEKEDKGWLFTRTEVRSKHGDSHLGHVFTDGPKPTGLRYCINSASLQFIPKDNLEKHGYGQYKKLFE